MARQTLEERNAKQRERQQRLRDRNRAERRPDRDDVARAMLFWTITSYLDQGRQDWIEELGDAVVGVLVDQGFDERAADEVFDDLVDRYARDDQPFRSKPHLRG
ncbi:MULTISPECIES: hypothetical protein [Agrobacterium]|uniref:hypothetical protein n=1 Tax=Agrobacterium TaxID=357 RepID=UPI000ED2E46B|nr:hypothetical protein [Agrobacterium sp. FDAARGOS_525]RSC36594.1 hypothetical protein EGT36_04390 [Agrobacterium sp. FDAARGOS_525]HCJ72640.1 hypothetical protein [Agrobacterium sp.]